MWPNSPTARVVVEATVIDLSCANSVGAAASGRAASAISARRVDAMAVLPLRNAPLRRLRGYGRKVDRLNVREFDRGRRKTISSPRRCAGPRLCVIITILVPAAWIDGRSTRSRACAPGSRFAGRFVQEQHVGLEQPRACQTHRRCSRRPTAPRRPLRETGETTRSSARCARGVRSSFATPATASANVRLPMTLRRRTTGRWNTSPADAARRDAPGRPFDAPPRTVPAGRDNPHQDTLAGAFGPGSACADRLERDVDVLGIGAPPRRQNRRPERQRKNAGAASAMIAFARARAAVGPRVEQAARWRAGRSQSESERKDRLSTSPARGRRITRVTPSMLPPTIITAPTRRSPVRTPQDDGHQREAQVVQQREG